MPRANKAILKNMENKSQKSAQPHDITTANQSKTKNAHFFIFYVTGTITTAIAHEGLRQKTIFYHYLQSAALIISSNWKFNEVIPDNSCTGDWYCDTWNTP